MLNGIISVIIGYCLTFLSLGMCYKVELKLSRSDELSNMSGLIIGGVEVPISMYPHVALITEKEMVICGGSIVSERVVLTAAHCFPDPENISEHAVYLGSARPLKGVKYRLCKAVLHELYLNNDLAQYTYDVAVILLRSQIIFGPTIKKIKIASNTRWRREHQYLAIAGFGVIENNGDTSKKLKATRMQYVDSKVCSRSPTDDGETMDVFDHMFCMLSTHWSSDCFGDLGSGVVWKHKYIVGVVSLGRSTHCGSDSIPSMYTDVVYFKDWINGKIKNLESQPVNDFCPKFNTTKNKMKWAKSDQARVMKVPPARPLSKGNGKKRRKPLINSK